MKHNLIVILALAATLVGCERPKHHHAHHQHKQRAEKETVVTYKVHHKAAKAVTQAVADALTDDDSYLYVIFDTSTRNYYSASSATRVTSYSSLSWSRSSTAPKEVTEHEAEEVGVEEVETTELGEAANEIGADVDADNASMDAADASTDAADAAADAVDASSDSSSGDSGGDSGGGDSGGDGGGGGE